MNKKAKRVTKVVTTGILATGMVFSNMPINVLAKEAREKALAEAAKDGVLWETSFEEKDFKENEVDTKKGATNIKGFEAPDLIVGDVTKEVDLDSIDGNSDFNTNETKKKLFDTSSGTKWLTKDYVPSEEKPIEVSFAFTEPKKLDRYAIVSANDSEERDPKSWKLSASTNGKDYKLIDEQKDQEFKERYEQKEYKIAEPQEYQYYKLEITANKGNNGMTQLADILLGTGVEDPEEQDQPMISRMSDGPTTAWNQENNKGWSGKKALEVAGTHVGTEDAHSWNVLYDNLDVPITENTTLSYVIFPGTIGDNYDYNWTQMNMAIDLQFDDGKYLSDYGIDDTNGNTLTPSGQGDSRTLNTNQWNKITARLGEHTELRGKKIKKVLVAYDNKDNKADKDVDFKNYFDDIKIYNQAVPNYDDQNLAEYVSILRGTNDSPNFSRGLTAPVVTMPHGFNFWAPVTNSGDNKMYTYQQNDNSGSTLKHISVSHEPSYWVGDRGNWEFMVNTSIDPKGNGSIGADERAAKFSHENETAKAHLYEVNFTEGNASGSSLALSPTQHGAVVKFNFDETAKYHNVILDLVRGGDKKVTLGEDGKSFTAEINPNSNGMKTMYVYGEFSQKWDTSRYGNSNNNSAIVNFGNAGEKEEIQMKVATSFISYDQAKHNLDLEIGNKSFDDIYDEARKTWNDKLDVITVKGASYEEKVTLYSNMYRMFAYPNLLSENTGTNENPVWKYKSTVSDEVKEGTLYYNNGFWDTYHTTWAAYQWLTPKQNVEMLNGLVEHYHDGEWVPRWVAPGGTNSMVGTSSDVIFGDAAAKGVDFELEDAYKSAIKNSAVVNTENLTLGGRAELNESIFRGYTSNSTGEGFSWSMEGYINDYGISQMATRLADEAKEKGDKELEQKYRDEAEYYRNRALNYVNLFDAGEDDDPTQKWFKGKNKNGEFTGGEDFNPLFWGGDYTETDAYNMTVTVPQDGKGLANLYGGENALAERMDTIFETPGTYYGYGASDGVGGIHEQREAREVKLGQYGHSNQPSHGILYMYNYAKQPWKTQKYVRDVLHRCYVGADFGQGYLGDEDNGEMSAWYVLSALGFYPVNMGSGEYAIGSPLFDEATVHLENGKDLTIKANNNSDENVYVQSMKVNGVEWNSSFIDSKILTEQGGTIEFNMGNTPNKDWGKEGGTSITKDDEVPNPEEDLTTSDVKASEEFAADVNQDTVSGKDVKDIKNLFDNNSNTAASFGEQTDLYYSFTRPVKVDMMTLTSTKDLQKEAPEQFTLYGSNDGKEWKELTTRDNVEFEWGRYTRPFSVENEDTAYTYYKVSFNAGTTLSEIELFGQSDDVSSIDKALLSKVVARAKAIDQSEMGDAVKKLLNDGIAAAEKVIENEKATQDEIVEQYNNLSDIISRVNKVRKGLEKIEAETFDTAHSAIVNDGQNIGGVKKDTWVGYKDVEFNQAPTSLEVSYSAQESDACQNGKIEVRLDSRDGEPLFTVDTHPTGSNWSNYVVETVEVPADVQEQFIGLHDVYFSFVGNDPIDEGQAYVANVDYFDFNHDIKTTVTVDGGHAVVNAPEFADYGQDYTFTVQPEANYKVIDVLVNDKSLEGYVPGTNEITIPNITEETTIKVVVKEDVAHNVTVSQSEYADIVAPESAKAGEEVTVQINNLKEGRKVKSVRVGDVPVEVVETENGYTAKFNMPYEDVTIDVEFTDAVQYDVVVKEAENGKITTNAVAGKITDGEALEITFTPNSGYYLSEAYVNGQKVEPVIDEKGAGSYVVENVKANVEVSAVYLPQRTTEDLEELIKQSGDLITSAKDAGFDTKGLEAAVAAGNEVLNDATQDQKAVDAAEEAIRVEMNKMYITIYIAEKNDINYDDYTKESGENFKAVLEEAKALLNKEGVTSDELSKMIGKLEDAEKALIEVVHKDELGNAIKDAEKLDSSKYTKESWNAFEKALKDAKAVYDNKKATQKEVDQAVALLEKAKADLVFVDEDPELPVIPEKPEVPEKPETPETKPETGNEESTGGTAEKADDVETGVAAQAGGLLSSLTAGGAALVYAIRRKRANHKNEDSND